MQRWFNWSSIFGRSLGACASAAALLTVSAAGFAQTDKAAAEALFREGMRLEKAGNFAAACPKLEESQRQEPSLGTQYYLADCYDHIGRSASAWANFTEVADKARLAKETAKEEVSRKRAAELEPKLARLTVEVDGAIAGLQVRRGDIVLGAGQWGLAVPIDPGSYVLRASAPGYKEWSKTIEVAAASSGTEHVPALEALPPDAPGAQPAATPAPTSADGASLTADQPAPAHSNAQRIIGIAAVVTGGVALGVSGVSVLLAKGANTDSNGAGKCRGDLCSQSGLDDRDRAVLFADVATVASIVGGALVVTGAVLWLTAPSSSHEGAPVAATQLGVGPRGLLLRGQF